MSLTIHRYFCLLRTRPAYRKDRPVNKDISVWG
uniref:Uncharacterized protein n=1 Tax=Podoviridae sp. ctZ5d16 TaxID=2825257 RepID=A0A8S5Q8Y2_9CAUD|nr:MAG TPA: hypothetical protein [Podoviridae sp. ctZ5d16]